VQLTSMPLKVKRQIHQSNHHRHFNQWADHSCERRAELIPNTDTATAMASSKLLEAAVNESVAVCE
jgi:hypothetical protein